jgi:hypothetical protein
MQKKILIGSTATNIHNPEILNRVAKDSDYYLCGAGQKIVNKWEDSHGIPEEIFDYIWDKSTFHSSMDGAYTDPEEVRVPPLEILYTIKLSHAQFNIHHAKTLHDLYLFQKSGYDTVDEKLHDMLYNFWVTIHRNNKKHVRLNQPAQKFFNGKVQRKYEHDSIHDAVKFYDKPLYKYIHKDGSDVMVDKKKFDALDEEKKIRLALEETSVIALERILIPNDFKMNPKSAQMMAFNQLVTSMTKGWFPKFMLHNYKKIRDQFGYDYVERFESNKHLLVENT